MAKKRTRSMSTARASKKVRRSAPTRMRKRSTRILRTVNIGRGFPDRVCMTHKYTELVPVDTGASGSLFSYLFAANGMWDPNFTSTGHQPMYFDQMTALYNHYTVIGSQIKIRLVPQSSAQPPLQFALTVDDDTTTSASNVDGINEQTKAKMRIYPSAMSAPSTISMKWSAKKVFGKGLMANTALQGSATTNPSELQYYRICYQSPSATSTKWYLECEITYISLWHERHDVATS